MSHESRTVLVVDDEPQVRALTCRALSASGMTCEQAEDGEDAFRKLCSKPYDALITDLRMPRRHGHALCKDALTLPDPPRTMVVTALADPRLVRDLMGRGVYDVVQKPVQYDVLAAKVLAMLSRSPPSSVPRPAAQNKPRPTRINLLHQIETTLVELTDLFGERLDSVFEFNDDLPDPPRAVREFIRRLAENEVADGDQPKAVVLPQHESRQKARVTCFTTAIAAPVDRNWAPCGDGFKLALRDLSESGGRLLHTRAVNADYLALTWNATQLIAKQIRVVCRVRRCKPCGPFYDVGGQFVMAD